MSPSEPKVDGRSLRYRGRREALLEAITAYVLDHGIGDLAMRPMAQAVGVSHVTLLNHFGTKEQLVTEIVDRLRERTFPDPGALEALPEEVVVDGAALLTLWWKTWSRPEQIPAMRVLFEVFGKALQTPDRYERFLTNLIEAWTALLERFVVAAGCPPDEIEVTVSVILAQMRGLQMDLLVTGDYDRVDTAHAFFVEIVRERQNRWGERQG